MPGPWGPRASWKRTCVFSGSFILWGPRSPTQTTTTASSSCFTTPWGTTAPALYTWSH
uniref:Uncharacterized protein n=1 Tax=Human herpesvirus 2 TaxID=10310 RepID=A0A481TUS8_HHV2|nr:hypothetical protein [Human alphaherpesvirus 2]